MGTVSITCTGPGETQHLPAPFPKDYSWQLKGHKDSNLVKLLIKKCRHKPQADLPGKEQKLESV